MKRVVDSFLDEYFQGITLLPGLFYSWENSLRFEIASSFIQPDEPGYFQQSLHRAVTLFHEVFNEQDEVLLVTDVHTSKQAVFIHRKPLNVYLKYIKHRHLLYKLRNYLLPSVVDEETELISQRFVIPCRKNDIRYRPLLNSILYKDFAHPSKILKNDVRSRYDIYFINHSKRMIFHLYDDRGCDILAADKENLRSLYGGYNGWILDTDRQEMDLLFK